MLKVALASLLVILDFSGSMEQKVSGKSKRAVMVDNAEALISTLKPGEQVATFYYGTSNSAGCGDTKSELVPANQFGTWVRARQPAPFSRTPLAATLRKVSALLEKDPGKIKNVIIVTDGNDTCGGDICRELGSIDSLLARKGLNARLDLIGYDLKGREKQALKCSSQKLTRLTYQVQYPGTEGQFQKGVEKTGVARLKSLADYAKKTTLQIVGAGPQEAWKLQSKTFEKDWKGASPVEVPPGSYKLSSPPKSGGKSVAVDLKPTEKKVLSQQEVAPALGLSQNSFVDEAGNPLPDEVIAAMKAEAAKKASALAEKSQQAEQASAFRNAIATNSEGGTGAGGGGGDTGVSGTGSQGRSTSNGSSKSTASSGSQRTQTKTGSNSATGSRTNTYSANEGGSSSVQEVPVDQQIVVGGELVDGNGNAKSGAGNSGAGGNSASNSNGSSGGSKSGGGSSNSGQNASGDGSFNAAKEKSSARKGLEGDSSSNLPLTQGELSIRLDGSVLGFRVQRKEGEKFISAQKARSPGQVHLDPGTYRFRVTYPSWLADRIFFEIPISDEVNRIEIDQILAGKLDWIQSNTQDDRMVDLSNLGIETPVLVPAGARIPVPRGTAFSWIEND